MKNMDADIYEARINASIAAFAMQDLVPIDMSDGLAHTTPAEQLAFWAGRTVSAAIDALALALQAVRNARPATDMAAQIEDATDGRR